MAAKSKYEILAALVEAESDSLGDAAGYHHTVVHVLHLLDDLERGVFQLERLPEEIYAMIERSTKIDPFEREGVAPEG